MVDEDAKLQLTQNTAEKNNMLMRLTLILLDVLVLPKYV